MTNPVPDHSISTPYGRRGSYWSCSPDASGNGIHTGSDYAAGSGVKVVAARPGTARHVNYGSSFGYHQLAIRCSDGTEDFYAHMRSRVADGTKVDAGTKVGEVGAEGNVTGPHLHFERHASQGSWSCSVVRDPAPSHNYQPSGGSGGSGSGTGPEDPMPTHIRARLTKPLKVKAGEWTSLPWDSIPSKGDEITPGESAIYIGGKTYVGTLTAVVTATGDSVRVRSLERSTENGATVTNQTYPAVEHPMTGGDTYVGDTRTEYVNKGRLVLQLYLPNGGTVKSAEWNGLYW